MLLKAIQELTNQVSRVAAGVEQAVKMRIDIMEVPDLGTCKCCGYTLLRRGSTECPACKMER
jgi:rubrerythrin